MARRQKIKKFILTIQRNKTMLIVDTWIGQFLLLIGSMTIFMWGLGASYEFDLKKVIALSTLTNLRYS